MRTAGVSSRSFTVTNKSNSLTYTVASSFVCTSPLTATTFVGLLETLTISNSDEFRSFLFNMCIDALESTTNSLSSRFFADGGGRHQTSVGGSFVLSFELQDAFGHSPRVSAGASLLSLRLFLRPILKFWGVRTALMRIFELNHSKRCTFTFSDVCVTQCGFCELHSSNWSQDFWALP